MLPGGRRHCRACCTASQEIFPKLRRIVAEISVMVGGYATGDVRIIDIEKEIGTGKPVVDFDVELDAMDHSRVGGPEDMSHRLCTCRRSDKAGRGRKTVVCGHRDGAAMPGGIRRHPFSLPVRGCGRAERSGASPQIFRNCAGLLPE